MIKLSFEDKLKEEKEDYCRFHCPVKTYQQDASEVECECEDCGSRWDEDVYVDISPCEHCQVDEFIRRIRDFDKSIIKEQRQLAYKVGYDQGSFEQKVGCCEE